jgi:ABC-type transporter Mla MlaB component
MSDPGKLLLRQPSEYTLTLILSGRWKLGEKLPPTAEVGQKVESDPQLRQITFDTEKLAGWDTGLLTFLTNLRKLCAGSQITLDSSGLPDGVRQLLALEGRLPQRHCENN